MPSVSVVLPFRAHQDPVLPAIRRIVNQDFAGRCELLAVANGFESQMDKRDEILPERSDISIKYLSGNFETMAAAVNFGIAHASGQYLAFSDTCHLWSPDKLRWQVSFLDESSEIDIVIGAVQMYCGQADSPAEAIKRIHGMPFHSYSLTAALLRRSLFDSVGSLDQSLASGEEIDWLMRSREKNARVHLHDRVSLLMGVRQDNLAAQQDIQSQNMLHMLKRSLDRRRASSGACYELSP